MTEIDRATIARLATVAGLEIDEGRQMIIAAQFAGLVSAANELNAKMAEPGHRDLAPALRFGHAPAGPEAPP